MKLSANEALQLTANSRGQLRHGSILASHAPAAA
jgi:hypothetical protein